MSSKRSDREKGSALVCLDPEEIFPLYWEEEGVLDANSGFEGLYQAAPFTSLSEEVDDLDHNEALLCTPNTLVLGSEESDSIWAKIYQTTLPLKGRG